MEESIEQCNTITGKEIKEALRIINKDLKKFEDEMREKISKKYEITEGQVDFLISIAVAEIAQN